jgi:hypothetical protein
VVNSNKVFIKHFLHCVFKELILLTDLKLYVTQISENMTGVVCRTVGYNFI